MGGNMLVRNLVFLAFFVLLLSSLSYSVPAGFSAYSGNIEACSCSVGEQKILLNNTGKISLSFSLLQKGDAAQWGLLAPKSFELLPSDSIYVAEFLTIPCSASGNYELVTGINTDLNINKVLRQSIKVKRCDNIAAKIVKAPKELCRCSAFEFLINVNNPSDFPDIYSFSVDKYSESAVFAPSSVALAPKQSADISLFLTPKCSVAEDDYFNIIVSAKNSGISQKIPSSFYINSTCYAYPQPKKEDKNISAKTKIPTIKIPAFGKYLIITLLSMPLAIALILVILLAGKKTRKEARKLPKKEAAYKWEKIMGIKKEKPKAVKETAVRATDLRKIFVAAVLVVAVLSLVLTANYFVFKASGNFSVNVTKPVIKFPAFEKNITKNITQEVPEAPPSVSEAPAEKLKAREINATLPELNFSAKLQEINEFASKYKYYIAAGIISLLLLILMLHFNVSPKNYVKKIPRNFWIFAMVIVALAVIIFILYQYRDSVQLSLFKAQPENITENIIEKAPEAEVLASNFSLPFNISAIKASASAAFPPELFSTYFPYVLAGFVILAVIIFFLVQAEKKK